MGKVVYLWNKYFIKYVFALVVLTAIIYFFDLNVLLAFKSIHYKYYLLIALLIPLLFNPLISNNRWRIFLKVQGVNESFFSLVRINFVSIFLGLLLPSSSGFDAIRIFMIEKRNKQKLGAGGASVIIERFLGFYILSFLGIIGTLFVLEKGVSINILYFALLINISIIFVFILLKNQYLYSKIFNVLSKIKRFKRMVNYISLLYGYINSFPFRKVLLSTIPLILLFQLSGICCCFLIFKAFGVDIPFLYHLSFMPLILIISIIPVSISGFGLREGGFVYFYSLLGIDNNISFLVSLLYYFLQIVIPAFIGFLLYTFSSNQFKTIKTELQVQNER